MQCFPSRPVNCAALGLSQNTRTREINEPLTSTPTREDFVNRYVSVFISIRGRHVSVIFGVFSGLPGYPGPPVFPGSIRRPGAGRLTGRRFYGYPAIRLSGGRL